MDINKLLSEHNILIDLKVEKKDELFDRMIERLQRDFDEQAIKVVRVAVFERESIMSTGVGKGLAIPHAKTDVANESHAVFARLDAPIEYGSIDETPVNMVFLLIGPVGNNRNHIKLLSRISRLMNSATFRDKILECETSNQILEAFTEEEQKFFPTST